MNAADEEDRNNKQQPGQDSTITQGHRVSKLLRESPVVWKQISVKMSFSQVESMFIVEHYFV
jgi:hypothetical protein